VNAPLVSIRLRVPLQRFALEVELESDARRIGIFGPSGAGKTTLLEALAGWRSGIEGRITIAGRTWFDSERGISMPLDARGIGYVPQEGLLFPHWSVRANVSAGLARAPGTDGERAALVRHVLGMLELEALAERSPATLSGGERQRVALARALCSGPELLLFDEPLGALDLPLRRRILPYLVRVTEEFGTPLLYVSHAATEVSVLCDEVLLLREGRVVARGRPADILFDSLRQENLDAQLENVLRGEVAGFQGDTALVALAADVRLGVPGAGLREGERVVLGLRADEILLATVRPERLSARNVLPARVVRLAEAPAGVLVRAELGSAGPSLEALLTRAAVAELGLAEGKPVFLVIKSHAVRVLSALPARPGP